MGEHLTKIKEYLRGGNPRIASAEAIGKTTPPGRGSRLLRIGGTDRLQSGMAVTVPNRGGGTHS
jgi:CO dehydrogenase maturation factor